MPLTASDFDYVLPPERIAQRPAEPRDQSRLMVLDRRTGARTHHVFSDLPSLLRAGDLLVVNDTRVIPARFFCRRASGGRIEGLFLRELSPGVWEAMLKGAGRCRLGEELAFEGDTGMLARLAGRIERGSWRIELSPPVAAMELLERLGCTPLPPYIRRPGPLAEDDDRRAYQTVFAAAPGAVAAPTAGLHFTDRVLHDLAARGVERATVTLHVGAGTFAPVTVENLADHPMHQEWFDLPDATAKAIAEARSAGLRHGEVGVRPGDAVRRVVAVGTTSVRVLETVAAGGVAASFAATLPEPARRRGCEQRNHGTWLAAASGWTKLFLYPPAEFRVVDALLTNFHLPRSTLLMLVAAFCAPGSTAGVKMILDAYAEAIALGCRFYSYGDAMLIV